MRGKIAYIMSRFPHLPETFILREMIELERQGWQIDLYPILVQHQPVVHAEARPWIARARKLPFLSLGVLASNGHALVEKPAAYAAVWGRTLREMWANPRFLVRAMALLPKAVHAARQMQREGVTHIHAHYATHPALMAWLIHRLTGISYSVTVHAHDIFVRTDMLATKLRDAAFVVAISEYNREHLARVIGAWVCDKIHVIHCGVELEDYAPRPARLEPQARFEILSVGSLQPYKGHRYLIEACAMLRARGLPFRCRIAGGGEEHRALERLIARLGLEAQVELLGPRPQSDVARLLPEVDCYVQPSIVTPSGKMEGIPVALMEALACELPVVATVLSGVPELVRPGETGRLVPPADACALANAISAVHDDPDGSKRMARAGRALVQREFDLRTNVLRLAGLFECAMAATLQH